MKSNSTPQAPAQGASFPHRWSSGGLLVLVGGLLLLYIFLAVSASTDECNTFDEAFHLTLGYVYWNHPEFQLSPDNGILSQAWAALPLLLDHSLKFPPVVDAQGRPANLWDLAQAFLYKMGNDPATILLRARTMVALLGAAVGALIFFWSRELFGTGGALISLTLFVFCPNMLANGALATTDMAATLGFFAATFGFWKVAQVVSWPRLAFSVVALGGLVITKMSSPLIVPVFLLILVARFISNQPVEIRLFLDRVARDRWSRLGIEALVLLAHGVGVIAILWRVYNFHYLALGTESSRFQILFAPDYSIWTAAGMKASVLQALAEVGLLPSAYLEGLSYGLQTSEMRSAFLCGRHSVEGWWWFFPFAFLVKTPMATLLLFLSCPVAFVLWRWFPPSAGDSRLEVPSCPGLYELSPLLIFGGVYGMACLTSPIDLGLRHLMPVYPVLFVLAGANVFWLRAEKPVFKLALAALLLGTMVESLAVWPNDLAFFNQLVGGPRQGYKYLVDSSLDWGQDLPGLRQWLDKNASTNHGAPVYLSYFGTGDPHYYGIEAQLLPGFFDLDTPQTFPLHGGIYCLSATMLQGVYSPYTPPWTQGDEKLYGLAHGEIRRWDASANDPRARGQLIQEKGAPYWSACLKTDGQLRLARLCAYLRQRTPDDEVGYSILIYRLSDEDVRRALEGKAPGG